MQGEPDKVASSPPIGGVLGCVQSRAAVFFELLGRLVAEEDVELIHDLRVASRRFNEALGLLSATAGADLVSGHRRWLGEIRDLVAPIRDADVMGQICLSLFEDEVYGPGVVPGEAFLKYLSRQRRRRLDEARVQLSSFEALGRRHAFEVMLTGFADSEGDGYRIERTLARRLRRRVRRRRRTFLRLAGRAAKSARSRRLHAARIAAKKLRYALELANDARILAADRELELLRGLQGGLGDLNDMTVLRGRLQEFAEVAGSDRIDDISELLRRMDRRRKWFVKSFVRSWPRLRRRLDQARSRKPLPWPNGTAIPFKKSTGEATL
jgi:CHAD domain-containing protein